MIKYFEEKSLPVDVKKYYKENKKLLSNVLDYLRDNYDFELIEDINFALFYSYIEIECATTIYVDDAGAAFQKVRCKIDKLPKTQSILSFIKELEKLERLELRRRKRLEKLMNLDFDSLELKEKKDVAYELSDSKELSDKGVAARYFLKIYNETKDIHFFCNYASTLYKSGDKEKAMEEYDEIIQLFKTEKYPNKGWVMRSIYADRMDYYKNDKKKFREIWDTAKADLYVREVPLAFPGYLGYVIEFAEISLNYGYFDICDELLDEIKKEKLPIPQNIKEHYGL